MNASRRGGSWVLMVGLVALPAGLACGVRQPPNLGQQAKDGQAMNAVRVTPELLETNGYRHRDGLYVREGTTLGAVSRLLGFEPADQEQTPGLGPDELQTTALFPGGRCSLDYWDPDSATGDEKATVTAWVALLTPDAVGK